HLHQRDGLATESSLYYLQHAEYALRSGDDQEAAKSFRLAFDCAKENVPALERLAELHLSMGESEPASAAMREAVESYERLGQLAEANRCRARLAQLGPARPAASTTPATEQPPKAARTLEGVGARDFAAGATGPPRLKPPG